MPLKNYRTPAQQFVVTAKKVILGSVRSLPPGQCARKLWTGMTSLLSAILQGRLLLPATQVSRLRSSRLSICRQCPLFDESADTCGIPGQLFTDETGEKRPLGCWCYLPIATMMPSKECWLVVNSYGTGWHPEPFSFWHRWAHRNEPHPPGIAPSVRTESEQPPQ